MSRSGKHEASEDGTAMPCWKPSATGKDFTSGGLTYTSRMLTLGDEDDLLQDIEEGIQIAMEREGYPSESIDPIKVNKLAHFVIQDLEVPVTYGWYKYGPAPVFETDKARIGPVPESEISASEESRIPDPGDEFYSPEEYAYYFTRDCTHFDRILQTPTKDYLIEFYEDHAPAPYGNLYEQSIQVQKILDKIKDKTGWHSEAEDYSKSLNRELTKLHRELLDIATLNEVTDTYSNYSKLLRRIIAEASSKDSLTASQNRFIRRVIDFFYSGVWRYAALLISKNTVHLSPGENHAKLLNAIERDLQNIRGSVTEEIESMRRQGEERGLYTEYSEGSYDHDSTRKPEDGSSSKMEPWTRASASLIRAKIARSSDQVE